MGIGQVLFAAMVGILNIIVIACFIAIVIMYIIHKDHKDE